MLLSKNVSADGEWMGSEQVGRMHMFPQILALLSGALNHSKADTLLHTIDAAAHQHRRRQPGYTYPDKGGSTLIGTLENGGVWPSQNHPLVIALSLLDADMALNVHPSAAAAAANVHPSLWLNLWSSSDVTPSYLAARSRAVGTANWTNFPRHCQRDLAQLR